MAQSTVSFVSEYILSSGRVATLHTQPTNEAMIHAASVVGFIATKVDEDAPWLTS
jgi:hypothetical protein